MKLTAKQAGETLAQILKNNTLPLGQFYGERIDKDVASGIVFNKGGWASRVNLKYEIPIWACECNLDIDCANMKVQIGWSSTHRSVSNAMAAIDLYQKVVALAAQVQAFLEQVEIKAETATVKA